jgi:menaquinone-dependent protoporphyrinogen oxidase
VVARRVGARDVVAFGGRLSRDELGLAERALVAMIEAEAGDFRDFDEVDAWAGRVAEDLRRIGRGGAVAGR